MSQFQKVLAAAAAVAALAFGASAIAGAATSGSSSSTNQSGSSSAAQVAPPANFPAHGSASHEDAEKAVTGSAAAKAQAAAVKSLGGGSAGAVTTDLTGSGYEVSVTKSDGSQVEVHLDSSFNTMQGPGGFGR